MRAINSVTLLNDLHNYILLLNKLEGHEQAETPSLRNYSNYVSLEYNTITIKLNYKTKEETTYQEYLRATFTIKNQTVSFTELSCENQGRETILQKYLQQNMPTIFPSSASSVTLSKETEEYLTMADEIAKQAYNCSSGDDYYPGYYSKIILTDTGIVLKQINHLNSRSLDHKTNYNLRNLEFTIPNEITESKVSFGEEKIGKMSIHFSDRSSNNNKICGDKIAEMIQEQKTLFENKNL